MMLRRLGRRLKGMFEFFMLILSLAVVGVGFSVCVATQPLTVQQAELEQRAYKAPEHSILVIYDGKNRERVCKFVRLLSDSRIDYHCPDMRGLSETIYLREWFGRYPSSSLEIIYPGDPEYEKWVLAFFHDS